MKSLALSLALLLFIVSPQLNAYECCKDYELPQIEEGVTPLKKEEFVKQVVDNFSTCVFIKFISSRICTSNCKVANSKFFEVTIGNKVTLEIEAGNDEYIFNRLIDGIIPLKDLTYDQCILMQESAKILGNDIKLLQENYGLSIWHPTALPAHRRFPNGKQILYVRAANKKLFEIAVASTQLYNVDMTAHVYYYPGDLKRAIFSHPEIPNILMKAAPHLLKADIENLNKQYDISISYPTDYSEERQYPEDKELVLVKIEEQTFEIFVSSAKISNVPNEDPKYYKSGELKKAIFSHPEIPNILIKAAHSFLNADIANLNEKYDIRIDYSEKSQSLQNNELLLVKIKEENFEIFVASTKISNSPNTYHEYYKSGDLLKQLFSRSQIKNILKLRPAQ